MSKKRTVTSDNYLEKIPLRRPDIEWSADEEGLVTLHIENKGAMNRIAQKLFKRPRVSMVHMEDIGSFLWPMLDGNKDIFALGERVREHFGEQAEPLYERLVKYFVIMESYGFIIWK